MEYLEKHPSGKILKQRYPELIDKIERILELKENHNVLILAHTYQREPIQLIADIMGDSLRLARAAAKGKNYNYILFCGVKFMAETAAILNPDRKVIFPEKFALCTMANYADIDDLTDYKKEHPDIPLVLYINSTSECKTVADIICTSANAIKITRAILKEFGADRFAFSPDRNLGYYISKKIGVPADILPPDGNCYVHNMYKKEHVEKARRLYPDAYIAVHPEAPWEVSEASDFVGSTSQIIRKVGEVIDKYNTFIIGTEQGVTDYLARTYPDKQFVPLYEKAICKSMKMITIDKVLTALEEIESDKYTVRIEPEIASAAIAAIEKMMKYS